MRLGSHITKDLDVSRILNITSHFEIWVRKNRRKVKCRKNMSCGFISTEENTSSCSQVVYSGDALYELQLWEAESISTWEGCYAMSLCISYAPKLYDIDSDSDRIWVQYEYDT
ncbi:hypothetical protein TSUD_127380 [Trifolium subterraneum]|nr:hypothetical protein TSUD_127380 [Trifolium subterraneum]